VLLVATEYGTLWMLLHRDPATGRVRRLYRHLGVNLRAQVCTPLPLHTRSRPCTH
jgi:hypothetical protein